MDKSNLQKTIFESTILTAAQCPISWGGVVSSKELSNADWGWLRSCYQRFNKEGNVVVPSRDAKSISEAEEVISLSERQMATSRKLEV